MDRDEEDDAEDDGEETAGAALEEVAEEDEGAVKDGLYNAAYFDSDDEEAAASTDRRHVPSADDLLYDESRDARDEAWVRKNLLGGVESVEHRSDAVLSCPCCLTPLCYDCQRHVQYRNQYRAMFVHNVRVRWDQLLRVPAAPLQGAAPASAALAAAAVAAEDAEPGPAATAAAAGDDVYRPVECATCGTEVAVFDVDEVFHLFNVLADTPL